MSAHRNQSNEYTKSVGIRGQKEHKRGKLLSSTVQEARLSCQSQPLAVMLCFRHICAYAIIAATTPEAQLQLASPLTTTPSPSGQEAECAPAKWRRAFKTLWDAVLTLT